MNNIETNKNVIKRAVLYCRVSTIEQAEEGNSLSTQEKTCREYANKNGYQVVEVFIERGESAKTANRTELQKMLGFCAQKKNGITAVIVYKIDRLSRNTDDYSQLRILLKRYGVSIKSTTEQIEDTPVGRFMENTMANIAQFDNDVRAERCSNGMRDAMREGRYVWSAPVGYSNIRVAGKATIGPNEMAPLVLRAFELVATGLQATDTVWSQITKEGLLKKNAKPVSRGYFYEMLRNELYTARISKFKECHKGIFKAIVSDELFQQVQRILKHKGHKVSEYKTDNPAFPLRRFVFSLSGMKLTGSFAKGKYPYYRFGGNGGNYERNEFERRFTFLMDSYSFEEDQITKLKHFVREKFQDITGDKRKEASKLEIQLLEYTERKNLLIQKNLKGVISDSVLKEQLDSIEKKELENQATLVMLGNTTGSPEEAVEFAEEYLRKPSSIWKNGDINIQTKLQWFQFPSGITFDGEKFGTKEISSVFKAKEVILSPLSANVVLF
jgi:DNA invertase Pin-like site-specific DNA recombinase